MIPERLEEANELVLSRLAEAQDEIILGFLPMSEEEMEAIVGLIRRQVSGRQYAIIEKLFLVAPAATAYALTIAPSRSLREGGKFYPSLVEDLDLSIPQGKRKPLRERFEATCKWLGVVTGTIPDIKWKDAAPFIFQAGILHYWKDALAQGIRSTLREHPAPDLEDDEKLQHFAVELKKRIHNHILLPRTLETAVGPMLVKRLINAFLTNNDKVLPSHLRGPLRESFQTAGRGLILRSPHLAFDPLFRELELVLPPQSQRIASPDTCWIVEDIRYPARSEKRIPVRDLNERRMNIVLTRLAGAYRDQCFHIDARLDESVPFRVFKSDTGRERRNCAGRSCSVSPGKYIVTMVPGVHAGDDDEHAEDVDGYRILEDLELRPGDEPIELSADSRSWAIQCVQEAGIFIDRSETDFLNLESGELLHYGHALGLTAFFPATGAENSQVQMTLSSEQTKLKYTAPLEKDEETPRIEIFSQCLNNAAAGALLQLPPGIHRLRVDLSRENQSATHVFWYWKGLEKVNEIRGFICGELPCNLDLKHCRGIEKGDENNFVFQKGHTAPFVLISLKSTGEQLRLPRVGVHLQLLAPEEEIADEPTPDELVIVQRDDRRTVRLYSGGFQKWELMCGDHVFARLDNARTVHTISLAGLCDTVGGAGIVEARGEDGRLIKLMTFSRPLTANLPEFTRDEESRVETWTVSIPTYELHEIGLRFQNLSEKPDNPSEPVIVVASSANNFENGDFGITEGLTARSETIELNGTAFVRVSVTIDWKLAGPHFSLVDFLHTSSEKSNWMPLRSSEKYGYSSIRLVFPGTELAHKDANWWQRLYCAIHISDKGGIPGELTEALENLSCGEIDKLLTRTRELLAWKYPMPVWKEYARMFQSLPVIAGQYCFNIWDPRAATWWHHAVGEIAEFATGNQVPVTRQMLFGSQPDALRIPPENAAGTNCPAGHSTLTERALNLGITIMNAGGLNNFIVQAYHGEEVSKAAFEAFENFNNVVSGKSQDFGDLDFKQLTAKLFVSTEELAERGTRGMNPGQLLSDGHLYFCIRSLNRRCRPLQKVSSTDQQYTLSPMAQTVEKIHQQLHMPMPDVSAKLGIKGQFTDPYEEDNYVYWWTPPCLENQWSRKVADLIWGLAAIARLGAFRVINPDTFDRYLHDLLVARDEQELRNRICTLLSLAPELFSFYVALFDLALSPAEKHHQNQTNVTDTRSR